MPELLYGDFLATIAKRFDEALSNISVECNLELGVEFEIAICKVLRKILPQRFGVCRGYVVSRDGLTAGDDVIIYERLRFPTGRLLDESDQRKERVPIEAVFAYIEAKHSLVFEGSDRSSFAFAIEQASKVKMLCRERESVKLTQIAGYGELRAGFEILESEGWPKIRNPIYTAVYSRFVRLTPSSPPMQNGADVYTELISRQLPVSSSFPDFLCAGQSTVVVPAIRRGDGSRVILAPFVAEKDVELPAFVLEGMAFGFAIAHLFWALDYIQLGSMPWPSLLRDAMKL